MSLIVALDEARYPSDAFAGFDVAHPLSYGSCRALAWAARFAYEDAADPGKRMRIRERWGLIDGGELRGAGSALLPAASTRGMVLVNPHALIVSFKGSDPLVLANWISDADALPDADGVHRGFAEAVDAIWVRLRAVLDRHGARKLYFTGHSLGGALAVVAAQRVEAQLDLEVAAVVTFGAPRVGTPPFATRFAPLTRRCLRFVHGADIVPSAPPDGAGYQHVGRYVRCASLGRFAKPSVLAPAEGNWPEFVPGLLQSVLDTPIGLMDGLRSLWGGATWQEHAGALLPAPLRDHLPDYYCEAFES